MTKKYITKTTKEYTYSEEGYVIKEVETVEEYEQEIVSKATIHTVSSPSDCCKVTRTNLDKYTYISSGNTPTVTLNIDAVKIQEALAGLIRNKEKGFTKK